jgi:LasA protease
MKLHCNNHSHLHNIKKQSFFCLSFLISFLVACVPQISMTPVYSIETQVSETVTPIITPLATRPLYSPGELVAYIAQTGDTLIALAAHFNTTEKEIRQANPILPQDVTTLPPGLPMKIPIYYQPLWGNPYQILPDSLFINGPAQVGFNTRAFVAAQPGWLKDHREYTGSQWRQGGDLVDYIATNFSVSPRLLLAVIEYQTNALSKTSNTGSSEYPLGYKDRNHLGLARQLTWAANALNNGYYGWRAGNLSSFDLDDGSIVYPDPWQNAASVGIQYYFSIVLSVDDFHNAINPYGLAKTYRELFGDPWVNSDPHIPGSLLQPAMTLPFEAGKSWAFTGGPHTGWGEGQPFAAIDFAPPAVVGGCTPSDEWVTAVSDGIIVRASPAIAVLDLDGDGDEHTGWVVFYLHLGTQGSVTTGTIVKSGDPIGHPSCEGGRATGTHIHIARKFNGEWILADSPVAFNLDGWIAKNGDAAYQGTLTRYSRNVRACICSDQESQIQAGELSSP